MARSPGGFELGDFGHDDQRGTLNFISCERRLAAVREVREGRAFVLSLPLDLPGPGIQPPFRHPPRLIETAGHNLPLERLFPVEQAIDIGCDDAVTLYLQYSTQWDALSHIGARFDANGDGIDEIVYYNGYRANEDIVGSSQDEGPRAHKLGIEHLAESGIQGRGVLVDLYAVYGESKVQVGFDALMTVLEQQQIIVEEGDILCLHTGFAGKIMNEGRDACPEMLAQSFVNLDGHDRRLQQWIKDSRIAAIVCDNVAVESMDVACHTQMHDVVLPLHHHCLFKLGMPLGELWYLTELAAHLRETGRTRFLLTAPPLRLPGAVGSPVTPVATV